MKKSNTKVIYVEPADYFPKEIREEFKLGEFEEKKKETKSKTDEKRPINRGEVRDEEF